jgi:hypothetical protein
LGFSPKNEFLFCIPPAKAGGNSKAGGKFVKVKNSFDAI